MYLPALTDEELLTYADTLTLTPLEKELAERLKLAVDRIDKLETDVDNLSGEVERHEYEVSEFESTE